MSRFVIGVLVGVVLAMPLGGIAQSPTPEPIEQRVEALERRVEMLIDDVNTVYGRTHQMGPNGIYYGPIPNLECRRGVVAIWMPKYLRCAHYHRQ